MTGGVAVPAGPMARKAGASFFRDRFVRAPSQRRDVKDELSLEKRIVMIIKIRS